jgi:multisubunit Na+/H+ antiporter MnhG subunit
VLAIFQFQSWLMLVLTLLGFAVLAWAFVDAVVRRPDAYVAADKLTKPAWLIILGIALAAYMLIWNPLNFLTIIGLVAAIVYLVDARPAMRALTRRR